MFYFVMMGILVLVLAASIVVWTKAKGRLAKTEASRIDHDELVLTKRVSLGVVIGVLVIMVLFTLFMSVKIVGQREVGVVSEFGSIVGQTGHGLVMIAPWQTIEKQTIAVQKYHEDKIACFSSETQNVFVAATLNWHVNPQDVQGLYKSVGPNFFDTIVPNRFAQAFKDETVKYNAVEIAPNREELRKSILARLQITLADYSIRADDLNITNISFDPDFENSILKKQVASQDALAAQNKVKQAEYEAQQVAAQAKGKADAQLIQAAADAKAIALQGEMLEKYPSVVKLRAIEKINPNVQTILLPAGSGFILPDSLFKQIPQK